MRGVVKEILYPILKENSANIEDAKNICAIVATTIRQSFNNRLLTTNVGDLGITEKLDADNPQFNLFKKLIDVFAGENLTTALGMLDGMAQHLDSSVRLEMKNRKLETLAVDFY